MNFNTSGADGQAEGKTKKVKEESATESADVGRQASALGQSSAKRGKYAVSYIVKIALFLVSLAVPPLLFNVRFLDWFKIWLLIVFALSMPFLVGRTRRGGISIAIQQFSTIGGMALGAWIGIAALGNPLLGVLLGIGGMFGAFFALERLYKRMGIPEKERKP